MDWESDLSVKHSYYGSASLQDWENKSILPPVGRQTLCIGFKCRAKKIEELPASQPLQDHIFSFGELQIPIEDRNFFNKSSVLKWMKVKMLRMNTF